MAAPSPDGSTGKTAAALRIAGWIPEPLSDDYALQDAHAGKSEGAAMLDDLKEFRSGLICLTGGEEGPLAAALNDGGATAGQKCVEHLVELFGHQNVYVELQRHGQREEEVRNQAALRIAESLHLPVLATNGVRYATQYEREVLVSSPQSVIISLSTRPGVFFKATRNDSYEACTVCAICFVTYPKPSKTPSCSLSDYSSN